MVGWFPVSGHSALIVEQFIGDTAVVTRYYTFGSSPKRKGKDSIKIDRKTARRFFKKDGYKYYLDQMIRS